MISDKRGFGVNLCLPESVERFLKEIIYIKFALLQSLFEHSLPSIPEVFKVILSRHLWKSLHDSTSENISLFRIGEDSDLLIESSKPFIMILC